MSALRPCPTLKIDSFFLAGPGNRGGLSPVFRPRLRPAEKTGTVTVYSSPGARIPRVPPRWASGKNGDCHRLFVAWSTHPPRPATMGQRCSPVAHGGAAPGRTGEGAYPTPEAPFSSPFRVWEPLMNGYSENRQGPIPFPPVILERSEESHLAGEVSPQPARGSC